MAKRKHAATIDLTDEEDNDTPLHGLSFLISNVYTKTFATQVSDFVTQNGGIVVHSPTSATNYLIQSWIDDDCDDRLELCCDKGITGIPFEYVQYLASGLSSSPLPFRHWALGEFATKVDENTNENLFNPVTDQTLESSSRLLGTTAMGTADPRSRESEELNQTYQDHVQQSWPIAYSLDGKKNVRTKIYLLPVVDSTSPDETLLLSSTRQFLAAYFSAEIVDLPSIELLQNKKGKGRHIMLPTDGTKISVASRRFAVSKEVVCKKFYKPDYPRYYLI